MDAFRRALVLLFLCLGFVGKGIFYGPYRQFIPNGYQVPNPCTEDNATDIWDRVGHFWLSENDEPAGDKRKNDFGMAFLNFKNNPAGAWAGLCELDSDGDSRKNGAELGDPNCVWAFNTGASPLVTDITKLSHPGIPDYYNDEVGKMSQGNRTIYCQNK